MRAIKYIRWSSEKQSKGSSLARQTKLIESFVSDMGWQEGSETIRDEGVSAWSGANVEDGALGEFTRRVKAEGGQGLVLVVEQQDRISRRDTLEVLDWFSFVCRAGLTVAFADSRTLVDLDLIRKHPQLLRTILESGNRANAESEYKSDRIRAAWEEMREAGRKVHTSGTTPPWLVLVDDRWRFEERPEVCAVINRIFDLYLGGMGKRTIAALLNKEGVPSLRGKPGGWHGSAVFGLIHNRALLGEYEHHIQRKPTGRIDRSYFPQVISDAKWEAAHNANHSRLMSNHSRTSKTRFLFAHIARCYQCDSRMVMVTKRITDDNRHEGYLICDRAYRRLGCTRTTSWRYLPLESAVLDRLLTVAMDDVHFSKGDEVAAINAEIAAQRRTVLEIGRDKENVKARQDALAAAGLPADNGDMDRYIALSRSEIEANAVEAELQKRKVIALGYVEPAEHIRRVAAVHADINHLDERIGEDARRLVMLALNDLIEVMYICTVEDRVVVMTKQSLRTLEINRQGEILNDLVGFKTEALPSDSNVISEYFRRKSELARPPSPY